MQTGLEHVGCGPRRCYTHSLIQRFAECLLAARMKKSSAKTWSSEHLETVVYSETEVSAQVLSPRTSTWSNVLTTLEAVSGHCDQYLPTHEGNAMTKNFGDWQWTVYGDAVHGIS